MLKKPIPRWRGRIVALVLTSMVLQVPRATFAGWIANGVPVATSGLADGPPEIVSDGLGGAIMVWVPGEGVPNTSDVYARRITAAGDPVWLANGIPVCNLTNDQRAPRILSDGTGGAFIGWRDARDSANQYDVYVQRIDGNGNTLWTASGVAVSTLANSGNNQEPPSLASDGSGGLIVVWSDERAGGANRDIYAQRISPSGNALWTANGVPICTAVNNQTGPEVISDGNGDAIVAWVDARNALTDVYAQRFSSSGATLWTSNGVQVSIAANAVALSQKLLSDGASGAIIVWQDRRFDNGDIYAQRIDGTGLSLWASGGVPMCAAVNTQTTPQVTTDGAAGLIAVWSDARGGSEIFGQRISPAGSVQWITDGVLLGTGKYSRTKPRIDADNAGGATVVWEDSRAGTNSYDIYLQRVNSSGIIEWSQEIAICAAEGSQQSPCVVSDGDSGAVIAWRDIRVAGDWDVYAQHAEEGHWGHPEPVIITAVDVARDQGGFVALNWNRSGLDAMQFQTITHYSVWRALDVAAVNLLVKGSTLLLQTPSGVGPNFAGAAILHRRTAMTDYYWEWVANQDTRYSAGYSLSASTRQDSTLDSSADHQFQVVAHTSNPFVFYESNVVAAHSVDNLVPSVPLEFTAVRLSSNALEPKDGPSASVGDVLLSWKRPNDPDIRDFSIYRSTTDDVHPAAEYFLQSTQESSFLDTTAPLGQSFYYVLTATDIHFNSSVATSTVSVGPTTNAGRAPSLMALSVPQNYPNPFAHTTDIEIGLPSTSDVSIQVYDVAGRLVRETTQPNLRSGWHRYAFDGRNREGEPLASGIYFLRVVAAGSAVTRKIVVAR